MITKVRKNFIAITMTMLTFVLTVPLCALNIITAALTYNHTNDQLEQLAQTEVYILEPHNNRHDAPPPEENFPIGMVKPAHTTPPPTTSTTTETTTAVTTTAPVDTDASGKENAVVNPKTEYIPPTVGTTAPFETNRPTEGTVTVPVVTTAPVPPPWEWGGQPWNTQATMETRPTKPTHPQWEEPPEYNEDRNNEQRQEYEWDNSWNGVYAAKIKKLPLSGAVLLSEMLSLEAETVVQSTALQPSETAAVSETTPYKTESSSEAASVPAVTGKVFDRELPRKNDGFNPNVASSIDHFIVYLDKENTVKEVHGTEDYSTEDCTEIISSIDSDSKYEGSCGALQYVRKDYTEGAVMVFSDRSSDIKMMKTLLFVSVAMFILMECIVFVLTKILTKRAMKPMQMSIVKQQQFISDAGHELKTPLTVISANADILADEIGDNKWLGYIKSQAERMRILVQEMLDLTKITGSDNHVAQSRFNLSSLVENVALPFECQAFEQKKTFHIELDPEVEFFGNTERIRRMVGIFVDNAFKYSNENGTIKVQLTSEGGKNVLKIYNTGIGIAKGEEEKIFERFYRSDSSRSQQGGYGLGLAIAKSIADQHGIKIQVQTEPGQWISFNLYL